MSKSNQSHSEPDKLLVMRHTAEHVLMMAMEQFYGKGKFLMALGPATDDGFYFDFDSIDDFKVAEDDFPKLEKRMKKIIQANLPMKQLDLDIGVARRVFAHNPYKQEWLDEIEKNGESAGVYLSGAAEQIESDLQTLETVKNNQEIPELKSFIDLCNGPHSESTGAIKAFKLLSIAGAYWRGDEKNKMLTRIYGTAFNSQEELDKYLWLREEAKKRDHRRLGKELDLFVIDESIGKGLPLLTAKGTTIKKQILDYEYELEKEAGFKHVSCPHIARSEIYKRTGHWDHFRDVMYAPFGIDGDQYVLKPMNCPHHYMIYASRPRSYRDLPFRMAEPGTCYRYEKSGELSGLLRVRSLTIDDSHILMSEDQIEAEYKLCIEMVAKMFKAFQLDDYYVRLSLADPSDEVKYIADEGTWERAGAKLEKIVKDNNLEYVKVKGEASFYGPKIDYVVKDSLGREWQMSTLQLDLFMGKRLDLTYVDKDGQPKHPVILHRGLTGSIERTLGILIEHFAGAFPVWLAPVQVKILPIADRHLDYAHQIREQLEGVGLRVEVDTRSERLPAKIKAAQLDKVPYMLIVGDKEVEEQTVNVRSRDSKEQKSQQPDQFLTMVKQQIAEKK